MIADSDNSNSRANSLIIRKGDKFQISSVTEYEIFAGPTSGTQNIGETSGEIKVLEFDQDAVKTAVEINGKLKLKINFTDYL